MSNKNFSNKRIAQNTILLYLRSFLLLLINLYTSRITLEVLGIDDYGIYQVVGGVVGMFSMLSSTLSTASQRFITFTLGEKNEEKLKRVFSACVALHVVLGLIAVFVLEVLGVWFLNNKLNIPINRLQIAAYVMHFSIATFFVNVISVPYNAVIVAHEKMSAFAYISVLEGILKLATVFVLMVIEYDKLIIYAMLSFLISVLLRLIYSIYSRSNFEETKNIKFYIDKQNFSDMFSFAGWNLIGSSALVLRNQGIDILLNIYFGVTVNAAKGICNQVQSAVHQLVGNFTTAVRPQLVKSIAIKDFGRTHSLIFRGGKMAFMLMMIISVPFILCCEEILSIWLVRVPEYSVIMVQISFFYLLTDTLSRFLINAVLANGDIKMFQLVMGGIKLLAIPVTLLVILLTNSPYSGVIVVSLIQFVCLFGELYYSSRFVFLSWKKYLKNVVFRSWITFVVVYVPLYVFFSQVDVNLIIKISSSILFSLLSIYLIGADNSERIMMKNIIGKLLKR